MRKILTKQEKEEQEEIEFCKNQEKALIKIKRLCEKLCGKKITDGYVGEDYLSKTVDDLSKSEFTYNNNDINKPNYNQYSNHNDNSNNNNFIYFLNNNINNNNDNNNKKMNKGKRKVSG